MKISELKANPNNPRVVKDAKFAKAVNSLLCFPKMLPKRKMIIDRQGNNITLGGNVRFRAIEHIAKISSATFEELCLSAGAKEDAIAVWEQVRKTKSIPDEWVDNADEFTEEEKQRFIVADNVGFGEWDWDILANDWEPLELSAWGLDIPGIVDEGELEKENLGPIDPQVNDRWVPDCLYPANNMYDIPTLLPDMQAKEVALPFIPYGAEARTAKDVATYHFYVDDYRFENVWNQPNSLIKDSLIAIVEPNLSLYDTTPISYGLHLIYKKRWLARYLQGKGVLVYADLNVSPKFAEYNILGLPDGWNAFFTRGYAQRVEYLESEYAIAQKVSGQQAPNFIVYAGGQLVKKWCAEHNVLYIEQMRGFDKMKEHKLL